MRKLHLQFKNADGSRKTIIVQNCHQNLSAEAVRKAMEQLIALAIFVRNGVQLCTEIVGAKYVETHETLLFDVDKDISDNAVDVGEKRDEKLQEDDVKLDIKDVEHLQLVKMTNNKMGKNELKYDSYVADFLKRMLNFYKIIMKKYQFFKVIKQKNVLQSRLQI